MVQKHSDLHHFVPLNLLTGTSRTFSPSEIHQLVALQVYEFCRSRNLVFVWVYLYSNWYTRDQWTLWARSARNAIPAGKTTMMIEAHWRVLKRVHLHHINRPRLDYLVYIIISRQCGRLIRSFNQKIATRQVLPEWEGQFRNEWKDLMSRPVQNNRYALYQTDPASWVCGCPYFIHSRFLLCKHLVHRSRHLALNDDAIKEEEKLRATSALGEALQLIESCKSQAGSGWTSRSNSPTILAPDGQPVPAQPNASSPQPTISQPENWKFCQIQLQPLEKKLQYDLGNTKRWGRAQGNWRELVFW
ncbi:hypothetical protein DM01DRAFT_1404181 [Hesseltinella vesiculosa]|uniref:SWIM-type domain-containing protein n=1 Tax=Hesseltinella vesiculosa TaxID=101127 RepID=A0A1X2GV01_9FUNG|nr:hypothetical protein DM01DRAFT_1404181 [Hesseltinella vesiculosa]